MHCRTFNLYNVQYLQLSCHPQYCSIVTVAKIAVILSSTIAFAVETPDFVNSKSTKCGTIWKLNSHPLIRDNYVNLGGERKQFAF